MEDKQIEAIFEKMTTFVITLAREPSSLGPRYFQDMIATCRNYLNEVSLVASALNRERLTVTTDLHALEATFELDFEQMLSTDPHVAQLSSIEDRKSMVNNRLRDQKIQIHKLREQLRSLDTVYKVVSHRSRELHSTMNAIKDQRRLMQTELATGAFYGDERPPQNPKHLHSPAGGPIGLDEFDEISSLLSDAASSSTGTKESAPETELPRVSDTMPAPPPNTAAPLPMVAPRVATPKDEEEVILSFLGGSDTTVEPSKSVAQAADADLAALFDTV